MCSGIAVHAERASRANDGTKMDDRNQPSTVAVLSHHSMSSPYRACGSGDQVDRWSRDMSGCTRVERIENQTEAAHLPVFARIGARDGPGRNGLQGAVGRVVDA